MIQPLVIANWKMNGSYAANYNLLTYLLPEIAVNRLARIGLCPAYPYLAQVGQRLVGSPVWLGAQNASAYSEGAHTGEVNVAMLRELGCEYVLVGHSERRLMHGEDDTAVAAKFAAVEAAGISPILCVGENLAECEAGETETVITRQVMAVIDQVGIDHFFNAVIAYEPGWANGTGQIASSEHVQYVHGLIRRLLRDRDPYIARELQLIYGGSVNPTNAIALFQQPDVNGALVGGASLDARAFIAICDALEQAHRHALAQGA
ncbi:MAG: triose-phosphate isomerase [Oleiphilaceae bacterium]|nr:triose-phosphate isomerase [Oleiphilaceae bacterium]